MPNHVINILDVTGDAKELVKFRKAVESTEIDRYDKKEKFAFEFGGTVPMPKELVGSTSGSMTDDEKARQVVRAKKFGAGNWYDWAIKFWGTKWGAYDACEPEEIGASHADNGSGLRYTFNTAWCPGAQWLLTTAEKFPKLAFVNYWSDEGGGSGRFTVWTDDGEVTSEDDSMSDHEFKMEFDPSYHDEYDFILEGDYKEFVEKYVKEEEPYWSELNPFVLNRLKDVDLPLFLEYGWYSEDIAFQERLKNAKEESNA